MTDFNPPKKGDSENKAWGGHRRCGCVPRERDTGWSFVRVAEDSFTGEMRALLKMKEKEGHVIEKRRRDMS